MMVMTSARIFDLAREQQKRLSQWDGDNLVAFARAVASEAYDKGYDTGFQDAQREFNNYQSEKS